jgi:hypothetical protein
VQQKAGADFFSKKILGYDFEALGGELVRQVEGTFPIIDC